MVWQSYWENKKGAVFCNTGYLSMFLLCCCLLLPLYVLLNSLWIVLVNLSLLAKWLARKTLWGSLTVARGSSPQAQAEECLWFSWFSVLFHCLIIWSVCVVPGPTWYISYQYVCTESAVKHQSTHHHGIHQSSSQHTAVTIPATVQHSQPAAFTCYVKSLTPLAPRPGRSRWPSPAPPTFSFLAFCCWKRFFLNHAFCSQNARTHTHTHTHTHTSKHLCTLSQHMFSTHRHTQSLAAFNWSSWVRLG